MKKTTNNTEINSKTTPKNSPKVTSNQQILNGAKDAEKTSEAIIKHINNQEKGVQAAANKAISKKVLCIPENISNAIVALFDNDRMPFSQYALVLKSFDGATSQIHGAHLVRVEITNGEMSSLKNMVACDKRALTHVLNYLKDKPASVAKRILDTDDSVEKLVYIIRGSLEVVIEDVNAIHWKGVHTLQ